MKLWAWIRSWLVKEPVFGEDDFSVSVYRPLERYIYKHFDGQKVVAKDPFVLHRRINDNAHALRADMQAANSDWKFKDKCRVDLLNTIRGIFDVKPLEQGGLTEEETLALFDHYLAFEQFQKKTAKRLQTTQAPILFGPQSSSVDASNMQNTTASSSTGEEPSTSRPTPSPSGPGSPSVSSPPEPITSEQ